MLKKLFISAAFASIASIACAQSNAVNYRTGGIGLSERKEMEAVRRDYNLEIKSALKTGHYLGDVEFVITNEAGEQVLAARSDGPLFFVKLAQGKYSVTAHYHDQKSTQTVTIGKNEGTMREVMLRFSGNEEIIGN